MNNQGVMHEEFTRRWEENCIAPNAFPSFQVNMRGWRFSVRYRGSGRLERINLLSYLEQGRISDMRDTFVCGTQDGYGWCVSFGIPSPEQQAIAELLHWFLPFDEWVQVNRLYLCHRRWISSSRDLTYDEPYGEDYGCTLSVEEYCTRMEQINEVDVINAAGEIVKAQQGSTTNFRLKE